jgi:hypothetical protein
MKLQLFINGIIYNELRLPHEEFYYDDDCSFEDNVELHRERLELYIANLKTMFFRQLCKAKSYDIVLIAESKAGSIIKCEETNFLQLNFYEDLK